MKRACSDWMRKRIPALRVKRSLSRSTFFFSSSRVRFGSLRSTPRKYISYFTFSSSTSVSSAPQARASSSVAWRPLSSASSGAAGAPGLSGGLGCRATDQTLARRPAVAKSTAPAAKISSDVQVPTPSPSTTPRSTSPRKLSTTERSTA